MYVKSAFNSAPEVTVGLLPRGNHEGCSVCHYSVGDMLNSGKHAEVKNH